MKTLMIGIAGGSGSGKTTLTRRIAKEFGSSITVLSHDDYYKGHDDLSYEERCKLNYDHPEAFDTALLCRHLEALRRGKAVSCPVYDYSIHNRSGETRQIQPNRVIVLEGILILQSLPLCRQLDIKVFVDADTDLRLIRRVQRDMRERGRSLQSVFDQYIRTVKPMYEQYVEPSRKNADLVIPVGGKNPVALSLLLSRIREFLHDDA